MKRVGGWSTQTRGERVAAVIMLIGVGTCAVLAVIGAIISHDLEHRPIEAARVQPAPRFIIADEPSKSVTFDADALERALRLTYRSVGIAPQCISQSGELVVNASGCSVAVGVGAMLALKNGLWDIAVGTCAGASLLNSSHNLLIGDFTATPTPETDGFVNIANTLCWWRKTGERAACPPPEPDCRKQLP